MRVDQAKAVARQWVLEEGIQIPGFAGAFYHGSIHWLPDGASLPPTSDVDIMVVRDDAEPPDKLGKFVYRDVLLEVSYLPRDQVESPEQVLGLSHLAGSFRSANIILDPSGWLAQLQAAVACDYAKRRWVRKRCEQARDKVLRNLQGVDAAKPFHACVLAWLFAAGVTTHILLVAGLKNPTVRKRYLDTRNLLAEYGQSDFYPTLLGMLGCATMRRAQVEEHLTALTAAFDAAKGVVKTPFPFASDISDLARPIAIDGSRDLIRCGDHREAIFWIVATYSRCQTIFAHDAPEMQERYEPGYRHLLHDLGITSLAGIHQRNEQIRLLLPRVWEVTEAILAANPAIEE